MCEKYLDIFSKELDVPEVVREKMGLAFSELHTETRKREEGKPSYMRRLPGAAVVLLICGLVLGTTAAARGIISLYRQRMQDMTGEEMDLYYEIAGAGEANSMNRNFTAEERRRYALLKLEYQNDGRFPQQELYRLQEGEIYDGEGIAVDPGSRTIYLPDRTLTDEELLEIIDFNVKVAYTIYWRANERILNGGGWESRMAAMTDEMVDEVYLAWCSGNKEGGEGYSRPLTEAERRRYEELVQKYEEEGVYAEADITIINEEREYTGSGVAFSVAESRYCIPDKELTDTELLILIDFDHRVLYCFDRIHTEIKLGFRKDWPQIQQ